jgi:hypothetical protein
MTVSCRFVVVENSSTGATATLSILVMVVRDSSSEGWTFSIEVRQICASAIESAK